METKKNHKQTFLVLVPHRDARIELRKYCDLMYKRGPTDVYNFPYVAPLADLSRALNLVELKQVARSLRETIGSEKILTEGEAVTNFSSCENNYVLYGPRLNITIPQNIVKNLLKINTIFSPLVIGCFLSKNKKINIPFKFSHEKLGFRAAAVANMHWKIFQSNGETYFKWKIDKLFWLPRPQKGLQKKEICNNKSYEGQKTP